MLASGQSVAAGAFQVSVLSIAPCALLWLAVHARRGVAWAERLGRRLHLIPPPPARPAGPPVEQIAADLRRITGQLDALPPLASRARRQGALLAYDDALAAACRALGLDDTWSTLPMGRARDAARRRIEHELGVAGLVFTTPRAA